MRILIALATGAFAAIAIALIPTLGLQQDEALFAVPLYRRSAEWPLMLMSYLGTLKTLLYSTVFLLWKPSVYSIRLPVVLITASTIWLTFVVIRKWHSERAALVTAYLLALDPTFIMTSVFDWGPVVLQHLLFVAVLYFGLRYYQSGETRHTVLAGLCCGLGLWDKASFGWLAAGLFVASALEWQAVKQRLHRRGLVALIAGLVLGASPLLWYNMQTSLSTVTVNVRGDMEPRALGEKMTALWQTLDGSFLFHYMVREDPASSRATPHSLMPWLLFLAVPLVFFADAPVRRTLRSVAATAVVAWLCMVFTYGTGGSPHHVVLLWPLPQIFVGIVAAEIAQRARYLTRAVIGIVLVSEGLVVHEYYYRTGHFGGTKYWTDAIGALAEETAHSRSLITPDWGIEAPLIVLSQGSSVVRWIDVSSPPPDWRAVLPNPSVRILVHTPDNEVFPEVNHKLGQLLAGAGVKQRIVKTIHDRNGRPIFEIREPVAEKGK